jgi:hypothetical protein
MDHKCLIRNWRCASRPPSRVKRTPLIEDRSTCGNGFDGSITVSVRQMRWPVGGVRFRTFTPVGGYGKFSCGAPSNPILPPEPVNPPGLIRWWLWFGHGARHATEIRFTRLVATGAVYYEGRIRTRRRRTRVSGTVDVINMRCVRDVCTWMPGEHRPTDRLAQGWQAGFFSTCRPMT